MSSKFESLYSLLGKAVKKFEEIMLEKETEIIRESAIQRFEFTFELAWKTMKAYLEENKGAKDLYFPKDTIRSAFQAKLLDNDPIWLEMVDTRNLTSHLYKESMALKVYRALPRYVPLIKKLVENLG